MSVRHLDIRAARGTVAAPELPDLEGARAEEILAWAVDTYFPDIGVASSMQDGVLIDLAWRVEPRIEVFFLDTGFHFPETIETAIAMQARYSLNLRTGKPVEHPSVYSRDGTEACCQARKVLPLERYLARKRAWISGVRRADGPTRADAKPVEWDAARGLVKVNPIVAWTDADVERYTDERDIIVNPLREKGYASIGCWPCTQPGAGREGRWAGSDKTECGLHAPSGSGP